MIDVYSDKTLQLNITGHYCHYCGKEMKHKIEWDEYQKCDVYTCDCDNSKYETQLKYQIRDLKQDLSRLESRKCSQEDIYKAELQELNKKYRKDLI